MDDLCACTLMVSTFFSLFLHALFVLCSFALSNVVPVLFPVPSEEVRERALVQEAQAILQLSNAMSQEGVCLHLVSPPSAASLYIIKVS